MMGEIIDMFDKLVDENRELSYSNRNNTKNNLELDNIQNDHKIKFRALMLNYILKQERN